MGGGEPRVLCWGIVRQTFADSGQPLQDNNGVFGAFNNLFFYHASVRPRKLRDAIVPKHRVAVDAVRDEDGVGWLRLVEEEEGGTPPLDESLYPSTVFGPTCDSRMY